MDLESYKLLYQRIEVPPQLSEKVLQHAGRQPASTPVFRWKRVGVRITAVCCALVLAVGAVVVGMRRSAVAPTPVASQNAVVPAKQQNFFDLAVYAAKGGNSRGKTVSLNMTMDWGLNGGSYWATGPDGVWVESQRVEALTYHPNILCTGTNLKSVQYSWDTSKLSKWELVKFNKEFLSAVDKNGKKIADPQKYGQYDCRYSMDNTTLTSKFTVDYTKKDISSQILPFYIRIETPMTAAQAKAYDQSVTEQQKKEAKSGSTEITANPQDIAWRLKNAKTLEKARLVLKATFTDGTTQQKRYRISPIEEKAYNANWDAFYKFASALYAKQQKLVASWPVETDADGKQQPKDEEKLNATLKEQINQPIYDFEAKHPLFTLMQVDN